MRRAVFRSIARTSCGTLGWKRILFKRFLFAFVVADLVHGEAAFSDNLLEGYAAFGVLPEPLAREGDCAAILFGQGLFLGMQHDFQELHDGGDLARPELLEQLVGMLFSFQRISGHRVPP